jgi:hypothetical protein
MRERESGNNINERVRTLIVPLNEREKERLMIFCGIQNLALVW